nr:cytochrome P450 [Actinomadura sp. CNU-125]
MATSITPPADLPGGITATTSAEAEEVFWGVIADPAADDPYASYRRLRELAPVLRTGDGTLVLSGHASCDAALRHRALGKGPQMFELQFTDLPPDQLKRMLDRVGDSMLMANPPHHTRLRRIVSDAFTPRHVADLTAAVTARAEEFLDRLTEGGGGDFMRLFAMEFPMNVIADLLGVPESDRAYLTPLIYTATALLSPGIAPDAAEQALAAQDEAEAYFTRLLTTDADRLGDGLLTRLADRRQSDALTEVETVSTALMLFGAGFETTTNLLGNSLHALMTHPDQLDRLAAHPETIPAATEELLRYDPPFQLASASPWNPSPSPEPTCTPAAWSSPSSAPPTTTPPSTPTPTPSTPPATSPPTPPPAPPPTSPSPRHPLLPRRPPHPPRTHHRPHPTSGPPPPPRTRRTPHPSARPRPARLPAPPHPPAITGKDERLAQRRPPAVGIRRFPDTHSADPAHPLENRTLDDEP